MLNESYQPHKLVHILQFFKPGPEVPLQINLLNEMGYVFSDNKELL